MRITGLGIILFIFSVPAGSQTTFHFRDFFYKQYPSAYTLNYIRGNDTATLLRKSVKVTGQDTIEVSDFGPGNEFRGSLTFVISEEQIKVIQARRKLASMIFNSEIGLPVWAKWSPRKSTGFQFSIQTKDTCAVASMKCYWEWIRHKQTGLKRGKLYWQGKMRRTISISFTEYSLYQPMIFSSVSGTVKFNYTYVFAEGAGLIKITTGINRKFKNTRVLQQ